MNLKDYNRAKPKKIEVVDNLFLRKLNEVIKSATESFEKYEYSRAKADVENFFWKMFCDNYLEIVKKRVYQGTGDKKISAQYTLYKSLLDILKMMAPITPFITEEIYQKYFKKYEKNKSIHISEWPKIYALQLYESKMDKLEGENLFDLMLKIIAKVRQEKTKAGKPMNSEIVLTINNKEKLKDVLEDLKNVTNAKEIKEGKFEVEFCLK